LASHWLAVTAVEPEPSDMMTGCSDYSDPFDATKPLDSLDYNGPLALTLPWAGKARSSVPLLQNFLQALHEHASTGVDKDKE
jgi:hypothetical protein